jgi:hypothetical protein
VQRPSQEFILRAKREQRISIAEVLHEFDITPPVDLPAWLGTESIDFQIEPEGWSAHAKVANGPGWTLPLVPGLPSPVATFRNIALDIARLSGTSTGTLSGTMELGGQITFTTEIALPGDLTFTGTIPSLSLSQLIHRFDATAAFPTGFDPTLKNSLVAIEKKDAIWSLFVATTIPGIGDFTFGFDPRSRSYRFQGDLAVNSPASLPGLGAIAPLVELVSFTNPKLIITTYEQPRFRFEGNARPQTTSDPSLLAIQRLLGLGGSLALDVISVSVPDPSKRSSAAMRFQLRGFDGLIGMGLRDGKPSVFLDAKWSGCTVGAMATPTGALIYGSSAPRMTIEFARVTIRDFAVAIGVSWSGVPTIGLLGTFDTSDFESSVCVVLDSTEMARSAFAAAVDQLTLFQIQKIFTPQIATTVLSDVLSKIAVRGLSVRTIPTSTATTLDSLDLDAIAQMLVEHHVLAEKRRPEELRAFVNAPGMLWHITDLREMRHYKLQRVGNDIRVEMQAQLYYAPQDLSLGTFELRQGQWLIGTLDLFVVKARVQIEMSTSEMRAEAELDRVTIGGTQFFDLTDASGTKGPRFSLLTKDREDASKHITITGRLVVLGTNFLTTALHLTKDGVAFSVSKDVTPTVAVTLAGIAADVFHANINGTALVRYPAFDLGDLGRFSFPVEVMGAIDASTAGGTPRASVGGQVWFGFGKIALPSIPLTVPLSQLESFLLEPVKKAVRAAISGDQWLQLVGTGGIVVPAITSVVTVATKHFGRSLTQAAVALRHLGKSAGEIAHAFSSLHKDPKESLGAMLSAGIMLSEAAVAWTSAFQATPELFFDTAKALGENVENLSRTMRSAFNWTEHQVANLLRSVYGLGEDVIHHVRRWLGL